MELYISEDDVLKNIREKFHQAYPFLQIEFYKNPLATWKGSPADDKWPLETPIDEIRCSHAFGWIDINPDRTITALESDFYRNFGLSVQVLRKGNRGYLKTIQTDHLTLKEQNEMGRLIETDNKHFTGL